ncbi:MAG: hypothetical protein ABI772_10010 [Bacteroidota bacterium]
MKKVRITSYIIFKSINKNTCDSNAISSAGEICVLGMHTDDH